MNPTILKVLTHTLKQGSPTPGTRTATGPRPVRNWVAQQEVAAVTRGKLHLPLSIAPHGSHYRLNLPPAPGPMRGETVFHETGPWC